MKEFEQMIQDSENLTTIKTRFEELVGKEVSWGELWNFIATLGHWDDYQLRMDEHDRSDYRQS